MAQFGSAGHLEEILHTVGIETFVEHRREHRKELADLEVEFGKW